VTHRLSRRSLLRHTAAGVGALATSRIAIAATGATAGVVASATSAGAAAPFTRRLPFPKVLTDADITLVAREAAVQILPGAKTRMWTFNGTFPGPTIRRPAGQRTRVTVRHELPVEADALTIHHHGSHSASIHDGLPEAELIEPRKSRTYVYEHMEDGEPERAAMQWYHDHSHHRTSLNSWMGLAGLFILDDEFEANLPLPRGRYELPLFLTDRRFDKNNQLDLDLFATPAVNREVSGDTFLVNGVPQPYTEVEPRRYRLRVHNGSGFRIYNLALVVEGSLVPAGALTQIGTESGLLPAPVERLTALLGPAERADLVVDFSDFAGSRVALASLSRSNALGSDTTPAVELLQFRVGTKTRRRGPRAVPKKLRPLPDWAADASPMPDRVFSFGTGYDPQTRREAHTINGRAFDHDRVDARVELDSVETWMLLNTTTRTHYIHIHDVDWLVLSRNGRPPQAYEAGLKETFLLDPGEYITVAAKFSDHLGRYMIHCHMLDHEDGGMMAAWEVVKPGGGSATTLTAAEQGRVDTVLAAISANPGDPAAPTVLEALPVSRVRIDAPGSPYRCTLT
jgi:spore coat protein A, manganese oxidase